MTDFWKSNPHFYCQYCKIFIHDNKASKKQHEDGLRHKENVRKYLLDTRTKNKEKEKEDAELAKELRHIESAAKQQYRRDVLEGGNEPELIIHDPEDFASLNNELTEGVGSTVYEETIKKKQEITEQQRAWQEYYTQQQLYYGYNSYGVTPPFGYEYPPYGADIGSTGSPLVPPVTTSTVVNNLEKSTTSTNLEKTETENEEESKVEEDTKSHPYGAWKKIDRKVNNVSKYGPKEIKGDEVSNSNEIEDENPFRNKNSKKRKQLERESMPTINNVHYEDSSSDDEEKKITKKVNFFNKNKKQNVNIQKNGVDNSENVVDYENTAKKQKMEGGKN